MLELKQLFLSRLVQAVQTAEINYCLAIKG